MDRTITVSDANSGSKRLNLKVDVDTKSGFCYGVVKAIKQAESLLEKRDKLYSLGAIVHNNTEHKRLEEKGMEVINHKSLKNLKNKPLFIRAHGEPPSTYITASDNGLEIIDCTCPVVLKLQQRIKESYYKIKEQGGNLLIFGSRGHAEVNGLIGQVNGDATVIENCGDLDEIDYTKPVVIFSQTTKDPADYSSLISEIKKRIALNGGPLDSFVSHNTICRQVSSRHPHIKYFASNHDVVLFVTSNESSNGRVLFESCKKTNGNCYKIENQDQIKREWFREGDKVGVCGATSTPMWLLEEIAAALREL